MPYEGMPPKNPIPPWGKGLPPPKGIGSLTISGKPKPSNPGKGPWLILYDHGDGTLVILASLVIMAVLFSLAVVVFAVGQAMGWWAI